MKVKIATLNVVSLITRKRKQLLMDLMKSKNIDIMCVQETKITTDTQEDELFKFFSMHYQVVHTKALGGSGGTAVFLRRGDKMQIIPELGSDEKGRVSAVDCQIGKGMFRIVSIYAPNEARERASFFESLQGFLEVPLTTVIAGDFNCVLSTHDRTSKGSAADSSARSLKKIITVNNLSDVAEGRDKGTLRFTHWQGDAHARLDRIYLSEANDFQLSDYVVSPVPFSDHAAVEIVLHIKENNRRKGSRSAYWKLNESVWLDESFCVLVNEKLEALERSGADACSWERFKSALKAEAIHFCQTKEAAKREQEEVLKQTIYTLCLEEEKEPGNFGEDIRKAKEDLMVILEERYKGAMVRSRQETIAREEQPSRVFLSLEKTGF